MGRYALNIHFLYMDAYADGKDKDMNHQEIAVKTSGKEAEKLFNFRPVFFTAIFLCLGILFAYAHRFYHWSAWWVLCCLPVFITPFVFYRARKRRLQAFVALSALTIAFCVGVGVFYQQLAKYEQRTVYNGTYNVVGTVVERTEYEYEIKVVLTDLQIEQNKEKGKLIAYLPLSFGENVSISDKILLQAELATNTAFFNEYGFRANDIGAKMCWETEKVNGCAVLGRSTNIFLHIRYMVEQRLFQGMERNAAGITLAVLTGDTARIEKGLLHNVRMGGIAHIFAVSGLHVGALYGFCLWLTEKTRLRVMQKTVRFLLMTALLLFYAGICGFSSSVMRAMTLCLVSYAAKLIGTESDMLQATGLGAILILLFKPTELFAIGFQLSFAACIGIALFSRPLRLAMEKGMERIKKFAIHLFRLQDRARANPQNKGENAPLSVMERALRAVLSFTSVSLAAQIATAPLLLYAFEYLSLWGLLLNGIFVPFIGGIFSILLLFVVAACLLPSLLSAVLLYLPSVVWSAALLLFELMDFSGFVLSNVHISMGSIMCYYGGWIFLTDKWNMSRRYKIGLSLICFLTFGVTMYALNM